ncbi:hypothetical protein [Aeoliella mucimassa]|nr:hypothetical protein [Aeoliella mucimassa]
MPKLQIIPLPDPYDPTRTRHLICCDHVEEGTKFVMANLATREAARKWIEQRLPRVVPSPVPQFLRRANELEPVELEATAAC